MGGGHVLEMPPTPRSTYGWQLDREPRLLNFMERRIQPHGAAKWSSSVVAEPTDSTFNQTWTEPLYKTIESEDTNIEEEQKNGAEQKLYKN